MVFIKRIDMYVTSTFFVVSLIAYQLFSKLVFFFKFLWKAFFLLKSFFGQDLRLKLVVNNIKSDII